MATRVIYGQKSCKIGATPVDRAISFSCDVDLAGAGTDVFIFGQTKKLGTLYSAEIPCTATVGWYLFGATNETAAGLTGANAASSFIQNPTATTDIETSFSEDGIDGGSGSGLLFTGGVVSNYSATLSVGEIPSAECEWTCTGVESTAGTAAVIPTVTEGNPPVLRPEDIVVTIGNFVTDSIMGDFCAQSVTVNLPLAREEVQCLGDALPTRFVQFPLTASITVSANTKQYGAVDFTQIVSGERSLEENDVTVTCGGVAGGMSFTLKAASIASQSISSSLDGAETIEVTYESPFGDATDVTTGLIIATV